MLLLIHFPLWFLLHGFVHYGFFSLVFFFFKNTYVVL